MAFFFHCTSNGHVPQFGTTGQTSFLELNINGLINRGMSFFPPAANFPHLVSLQYLSTFIARPRGETTIVILLFVNLPTRLPNIGPKIPSLSLTKSSVMVH